MWLRPCGFDSRLRNHEHSIYVRALLVESHQINTTDVLWPPTLNLPARPPKLVYLDLNHWIELSKAHSGHPDGEKSRGILDACLKAVGDGNAVFPLSEYFYVEILKIKNYRQRRDLRDVIEQVCGYKVVTSLVVVVTHEIGAVLDQVLGPNPAPYNKTNYLEWGVNRAFGRVGDVRIVSASGDDVTEQARQTYPHGSEAFDNVLLNAQLELNRKVIEGPTPEEEPEFRLDGWSPEETVRVYKRQASDEIAQVRRFDNDPKWRRGRIRDAIAARQLAFDVGDILAKCLAGRGFGASDQFFGTKRDELLPIVNAMPSFDVSVTLKSSLHRDANHRWTNNDIFDIRALSLTIPYCDVVVTDRSMWSHVTRHKLPHRYDTVVIHQLTGLLDHLGSN